MNYKNTLQEYCQKNKLTTPKYNTIKIGGSDHIPIWKAELIIDNNSFTSTGKNKKEAEYSVAKIVYDYITKGMISKHFIKNKNSRIQKVSNLDEIDIQKYKYVVLVDAENIDVDSKYLHNKDILFIIFVAKNTSKNWIFDAQENINNCFVFISQCVGRDAADHLLTFYLGKLSIIAPKQKYYILTKDHYGEYLQYFCNNTKFICSCDEL